MNSVYVDGQEGTTGLQIRERLASHGGVRVLEIEPDRRKDVERRRELINEADVVFLCLPDAASRESVTLIDAGNTRTRVLDASTAHRVADGWTYGLPELSHAQRAAIRGSRRVAVTGCHAAGFILALAPLVANGTVPRDYPITCHSLTGYSGGGKSMIAAFEAKTAPDFELYGLGLGHKHVPELQKYSMLEKRPIFVPSVGNFRQGMLVSVPLHLDALPGKPKAADLQAALEQRYAGSTLVSVQPAETNGKIEPQALNDSDRLELRVFANEAYRQAVLVARLDNLGKGASGAAVQNIKLMLGLE
jgi:N-acetyl-gamma-glutamyl-phosphate reductase